MLDGRSSAKQPHDTADDEKQTEKKPEKGKQAVEQSLSKEGVYHG